MKYRNPNVFRRPLGNHAALGKRQISVLRGLEQIGEWNEENHSWNYDGPAETVRILDSLVKRGLVEKISDVPARYRKVEK